MNEQKVESKKCNHTCKQHCIDRRRPPEIVMMPGEKKTCQSRNNSES